MTTIEIEFDENDVPLCPKDKQPMELAEEHVAHDVYRCPILWCDP